jgi:hypothetical protein
MSSKRRSYDTDEITLRKIFAKSAVDNKAVGAMRVLTADGTGGTYWGIPSTLGLNPSFNQINTDAGNFTADLSYNIFTLTQASGIGFSKGAGSNQLYIYGKAFNQIDVSGNSSLYGFTNNVVTPTVTLAGSGGISIRSNPQTNTLVFDAVGTQISSSIYSFQKVQVFSNASTITDQLSNVDSIILNAASPSTTIGYVGLNDIQLFTNATSNIVYFGLKQSTGSISTLTGSNSYLSTLISVNRSTFSNAIASGISTLSLSTTNIFTSTITFNDIITSAKQVLAVSSGILTLNGQGITGGGSGTGNLVTANLVSTVMGLGTAGYVSTPQLVSSIVGLGSAGYVSSMSTNVLSTGWLKGGIAEVSTINFKDSLNTNIYALVSSNASLYFNGTLVGSGSVINNTNISTYIYQVSSVSTLYATANTISISTATNVFLSPNFFSSIFFSTGNLVTSSVGFNDTVTNARQNLTVTNGNLLLNRVQVTSQPNLVSTVIGLGSSGYISSLQLVSTVTGLGSAGYISSPQLTSTTTGIYTSFPTIGNLVSSIAGLGNAGYISSSQLTSTVTGLGTAGYVSSTQLTSTTRGIYTRFPTVDNIVSTVIGLGTAGYISSSQLTSTTAGIYSGGLGGGITTANLVSSVVGLGAAGYVSSTQLTSTATGIYNNFITTGNLVSSVRGLGAAGYVSSTQLTSTITGLSNIAVTKIIAGTNVTISPTSGVGDVTINASGSGGGGTSFTAFSTILISTLSTTVNMISTTMEYISYSSFTLDASRFGGPPGVFLYLSTGNSVSQMSSVQFKIDNFSSYIRSSANIYVGLQYNYLFSRWTTPQYLNNLNDGLFDFPSFVRPYIGVSTSLLLGNTAGNFIAEKYSPNVTGSYTANYAYYDSNVRAIVTGQTDVGQSNSYNRNHLLKLPTTSFDNLYRSTFTLYHRLDYGYVSQGQYNTNIANLPAPTSANYTIISGYSGFSTQDVMVDVGRNNPITLYVTN